MNTISSLSYLWRDINRSAHETKQISIQVLEQLEKQEQIIMNANNNLNQSRQLLVKSDKLLNDMSWIGWFIGFIPFKSFFSGLFKRKQKEDILFIEDKPNNKNEQSISNIEERNLLLPINYDYPNVINNDIDTVENKNEMLKLEKELSDLLWIGSKIGEQLDLHNNYLDKMNDKTEIIFDKTKKSTKTTNSFL